VAAVAAILRREWIKILVSGLLVGSAFLAVAFLLPSRYRAVTTLLPVADSDQSSIVAKLAADFSNFAPDITSSGTSPSAFPDVVRSRRVLESLLQMSPPDHGQRPLIDFVEKHGNDLERRERAVKKLRKHINASLDRRTGLLTIEVEAGDPELAAWGANCLDSLLQVTLTGMLTSQAGAKRSFIEGRLTETQARLTAAEEALKAFREANVRYGNAPGLQLEEGRLTRSLREQEEVYLTLQREYELSRINEHRTLPVLSIVDPAYPPTQRSWPKRKLALLSGFLLGAAIMAFWTVWTRRPGRIDGHA
jgi:uncharacterized protein involved in exopolysaccharide biosynthesis